MQRAAACICMHAARRCVHTARCMHAASGLRVLQRSTQRGQRAHSAMPRLAWFNKGNQGATRQFEPPPGHSRSGKAAASGAQFHLQIRASWPRDSLTEQFVDRCAARGTTSAAGAHCSAGSSIRSRLWCYTARPVTDARICMGAAHFGRLLVSSRRMATSVSVSGSRLAGGVIQPQDLRFGGAAVLEYADARLPAVDVVRVTRAEPREVSDLQSYPSMGGVWGFLYLLELTCGQRCPRILQFSHSASMGNTEQQQRARVRPHTGGSGAERFGSAVTQALLHSAPARVGSSRARDWTMVPV
eukprot:SAG22_NODE_950_length_6352_cov_23.892212_2_plen_300_part_00